MHSMKHRLQKKTETNTSKSCRCVPSVCTHAHIFRHTSTALVYTFEIQCVILHIDAHLHTHRHADNHTHTQTVSIQLLLFVLVVVYYRSQLCNCVGVAYFSPNFSLIVLSSSLPVCLSVSFSVLNWTLNFDKKKPRIDSRAATISRLTEIFWQLLINLLDNLLSNGKFHLSTFLNVLILNTLSLGFSLIVKQSTPFEYTKFGFWKLWCLTFFFFGHWIEKSK